MFFAAARSIAVAALACVAVSCDRPAAGPTTTPSTAPVRDGIVSLSPAATDLLVAMNASGRVVGVSNYEPASSSLNALPRVGDYLRTDWEKIDAAKPGFMIVQGREDRLPAGLRDQAKRRGIDVVALTIDRLSDISAAARTLQDKLHVAGADAFRNQFEMDLAALQRDATSTRGERPPVRTLLVVGDEGTNFVGTQNFLDDLLTLAGGQNVVAGSGYVSLDREKIAELNPDVILLLLPAADEAAVARAKAVWQQTPNVAAVKNSRVHALVGPQVLQPDSHVAETGREMMRLLYATR